jgi:hypothetical protein
MSSVSPVSSRQILVILPRGEAIRNFVYSGALERVATDASVTVLSVRPSDAIWNEVRSRLPQLMELTEIPERRAVWTIRELLDMAHGRWLWSGAARNRWLTRDGEANTVPLAVKRNLKKAVCYPFANRPGLKALSQLERVASHALRTSEKPIDTLRSLRPTLVFNGSHVHSTVALPWVRAANALKIPTATFLFSWDNLTSQGRILPRYDHYLAWNENIREQLLRIYPEVRREQVRVTGTPQFDFHFQSQYRWSREEFCRRVNADPSRPIVLYTTSMARPVAGEERVVERIAAMLRQMTDLGPPQLLVRVYPKDRTGRFEDMKRRCPDVLFPPVPWEPNWLTPTIDDLYLFTNSVHHAALGINVASTVTLELCMFGKPVINVAYNPPDLDIFPFDYRRFYDFDHYRPVTRSQAVLLAWDEKEMPGLIRRALAQPEATREHQARLLQNMFGRTLDGRSADRVADTLLDLSGVQCRPDGVLQPA